MSGLASPPAHTNKSGVEKDSDPATNAKGSGATVGPHISLPSLLALDKGLFGTLYPYISYKEANRLDLAYDSTLESVFHTLIQPRAKNLASNLFEQLAARDYLKIPGTCFSEQNYKPPKSRENK